MASPKTLEDRAWRKESEKRLRGRVLVPVLASRRNARRTAHKNPVKTLPPLAAFSG